MVVESSVLVTPIIVTKWSPRRYLAKHTGFIHVSKILIYQEFDQEDGLRTMAGPDMAIHMRDDARRCNVI